MSTRQVFNIILQNDLFLKDFKYVDRSSFADSYNLYGWRALMEKVIDIKTVNDALIILKKRIIYLLKVRVSTRLHFQRTWCL